MSPRNARTLTLLFVLVLTFSVALTSSASANDGWIDQTIRGMSLEEKVGQLFVANVYGQSANTRDEADVAANQEMFGSGIRNANQLIDEYKLGGLVYFRWSNNLDNPEQIARLSNGIQEAALRQKAKVPLLIATDQEHGVVSRVWAPATEFPGDMALGATRREVDSRDAARVTATELARARHQPELRAGRRREHQPPEPGDRGRSFGDEPGPRSRRWPPRRSRAPRTRGSRPRSSTSPATATPCRQPHGLPVIYHSREQWEQIDAPPFRAAIAAGADMVMSAHVVMPELQSDCNVETQEGCDPATLDREILTGLLREELGYDGVV